MNGNYSLPPLRDLPARRLEERKQHLLAEIRGSGPARRRFSIALRHRRLALILATVVVLGALVATPALGLRGALLDLLGRSDVRFSDAPAAASVIRREFAEMSSGAPEGMDPKVIAGQTRLAATLDFGGSARRVWVAPTMTGGFCYVIQGISGGCQSPAAPRDSLQLDGGYVLRADASEPAMDILAGKVFEPAAQALQVTFEDGKTISLPFVYVSAPIDAGFFAYKPTPAQQRPGHRPASIVLTDADGTTLARHDIDWANEARKAEEIRKRYQSRLPRSRAGDG